MKIFKNLGRTIANGLKTLGLLPGVMMNFREHRRLRVIFNENETERLDRIRNPSKYRCK